MPLEPSPLVGMKTFEAVVTEIENRQKDLTTKDNPEVMKSLVNEVRTKWQAARDAKAASIEGRLLRCKRAVRQEYEPAKRRAIQTLYGKEFDPPYPPIIATKRRDLVAWLRDFMLRPDSNLFDINSTPLPNLPGNMEDTIRVEAEKQAFKSILDYAFANNVIIDQNQVLQYADQLEPIIKDTVNKKIKHQAKEAVERMKQKISDQLVEGDFTMALKELIDDIGEYPNVFMEGPIQQKVLQQEMVYNEGTGKWSPQVSEQIINKYERFSPFDAFPQSDSHGIEDGYFFRKIAFEPQSLSDMIDAAGYDTEAIKEVLRKYRKSGYKESVAAEAERAEMEDRSSTTSSNKIDCLKYWGSASGESLIEWAGDASKAKSFYETTIIPEKEYQIIAWVIDQYVIKAMLNPDPLGRKNVYTASFDESPDNFWSPTSLPETLWDVQMSGCAIARAIVLNVGFACLTGDTIVYRHEKVGAKKKRKNSHKRSVCEVTLNHLWEVKNGIRNGITRNQIRSLDETTGEFYGNKILDIVDNGIRPVYRVTTKSGYSIKATMNHRFMREDGTYQELEDFSVGSLIAVNGRPKKYETKYCIDCGVQLSLNPMAIRCKSCAGKINTWNMTQKQRALENPSRWWCDCKAKEFKKTECEFCGAVGRVHLHHIDRNHFNYHKENLLTLCEPCHKKWHMEHDFFGDPFKHTYIDYDAITEIIYVGEERVFDLQMEAPNHNFVANGFVSHNSGPQIEYDGDRFPDGVTPNFYPLKQWKSTGSQMASGKPVNFWQPELLTDSLRIIYEFFRSLADEYSGIPRYMQGEKAGSNPTASGFSMQISQQSRGLKSVLLNIAFGVIEPAIKIQYLFNLSYEDDIDMVGDSQIVAKASQSIIAKEQLAIRRKEILGEVVGSPVLTQAVGIPAILKLFKASVQAVDIDLDDLFKDSEMIDEIAQMIPAQAPPIKQLNQATGQLNEGTPPATQGVMPSGEIAGGGDTSLFKQTEQ